MTLKPTPFQSPACRQFAVLLAILACAGCSKPPQPSSPPAATAARFWTTQTISVGDSLTYDDGLVVTLKAINDSRCKPGVQCIWSGELSAVLGLRGGDIGATAQELILGTVRNNDKAIGIYKFNLVDATTTSIMLVINKPDRQKEVRDLEVEAKVLPKDALIRIASPVPNQVVTSPFTVTGEARGSWFFEASFPVKLLDSNGKVLVQTHATAKGEWMTQEFVPFTSTLTFAAPATDTGKLVLEKDNPSGEPERDDSRVIEVRFR